MISAILAAPLLAALTVEPWTLAPPAPESKSVWKVEVQVEAQSEQHAANFNLIVQRGKTENVTYKWGDLEVDSQSVPFDEEWTGKWDAAGALTLADNGDETRRMLLPFQFAYSEKPVDVGSKWTFEYEPKGGAKVQIASEAIAIEKVKDVDTLKIKTVTKELKGEQPMSSKGTWWVDRSGKIVKFELNVTNWIVVMADAAPIECTIKGIAK